MNTQTTPAQRRQWMAEGYAARLAGEPIPAEIAATQHRPHCHAWLCGWWKRQYEEDAAQAERAAQS